MKTSKRVEKALRGLQRCANDDPQALAAEITEIANERDRLLAENKALREARSYMAHRAKCIWHHSAGHTCDCGFAETVKRIDAALAKANHD